MTPVHGPTQDASKGEHPRLLVALLTFQTAGAERVAYEVVRGLASDFDIQLLALKEDHPPPESLPAASIVVGMRRLLFAEADILQTQLFLPGLLARIRRLWDKRTRWVHVVQYHNYEAIRWGSIRRWMDHRWIFPAADVVVAAGDAVAASLPASLTPVNIPNAVDLTPAGPSEPRTGPPVVGTVSMLRPEKGIDRLISATAVLREQIPGLRVVVAGEGPERPALEARIRSLGLEDTVTLRGYVNDLDAFYRSLDVYVQPSDNEPFGIAALEAYRFGIPLVVTNGGNLPRLTGDGAWGVVADHNPDGPTGLAAGIQRAWSEREDWAARAVEGRTHWSARLSVQGMVQSYCDVFRQLL